MEEKKTCPFCGHELELECKFLGEGVYRCSNCGSEVCFGKENESRRSGMDVR